MEQFPFTDADWDTLKPLALAILNASLADDEIIAASLRIDMLELLDGLRAKYGDHPVLLETEADYTDDSSERVSLYRQAVKIAEENGLQTLSIRMSLAFTLMQLDDPVAALDELWMCGGEVDVANDDERKHWLELLGYAADYTKSGAEREMVTRRAIEVAAVHEQPTLFLRLCLTRHLLDSGNPAEASKELRKCRSEVPAAEEDDRTFWAGLVEEVNRATPGTASDTAIR